MSYTFNAPRSEHRGVEVGGQVGVRARLVLLTAAYTYDNQIYTQYTEQLSAGALRVRPSTAPATASPACR